MLPRIAAGTAAIWALAGTAALAAPPTVERSGNTYHVAVCPGPAAPGTARCHAHVVTDKDGAPIESPAQSNALPPGYGPSDLRSAYNVTGSGAASTVVAIVDAYGYTNAESDLAVYRSTYGLPA